MTKTVLYVVGAVLTVVGVLGFVNNPVLGIFAVDTIHNLIHIVTGLALLWAAYSGGSQMRTFAIVLGIVYAIVAVLGFILPGDSILGLIESNMADDVLHLVLAAVLLYVGFMGSKSSSATPMSTPPSQGGSNMPMGGGQQM
jgi:hypothetical protein